MMVTISVVSDTSGVQPVMVHSDQQTSRTPSPISMRGSIFAENRPASIIAAIVPMPRGAITRPAVSTG